MANFEPKEFNASDINGGQKFNAGDGITPEAINAPIESALLMQKIAKNIEGLIEKGVGYSSIVKSGFTTTDSYGISYNVPKSEANGDGAISLMGTRYDNVGLEGAVNGRANGKQSLNGAVSGLADGDFSATFNHKTKAYQKGSIAVNGHSEAGMTEAEFLAKYPSGIEPHENLNYADSWSLAFSCGERTKAKGRGSFASGFKSYAWENFSSAKGICTTADRIGQSVDGVYNKRDTDATYIIGNGWETNNKDFTTGTEPTAPEKSNEIKRFNNFYISKRGEIVVDGEKLDTFGKNYIPSLKLIQHPNGYTGAIHHPLSIWWTNNDGNTAKAELMAKDNASGTNGHVSLEYFKYKNPSGQTESSYLRLYKDRIETNKPIYANGVLLGAGGSGGKNTYYFAVPKNKGTVGYPIWVLPPIDDVKKIELVRYTWGSTSSNYGGYPTYSKKDINKTLYEDSVWNLSTYGSMTGFYLDFTFNDNSGSVSDSLFFITESYGLIELYNYESSSYGGGAIWERGLIPSSDFDYDNIELVFKITMK